MAQPTFGVLWSIVLVLFASRLGRGELGFLEEFEQRVDHIVELVLGEAISLRVAKGDTHFRRHIVVVVFVVVVPSNAGSVGRVRGTGGRLGEIDERRDEEVWIGDKEAICCCGSMVIGWPPGCEPADKRRERREARVELAAKLGGRGVRKGDETHG